MKVVYIAIVCLVSLFITSCGASKHLDTSTSWVSVANMEDTEIFVDPTSIKHEGTMIIAKEKKVYHSAASKQEYIDRIRDQYTKLGKTEKADKWLDVSYSIYTSEYDCLNSRFKVLNVEDYDSQGVRIVRTTPNKKKDVWLTVDRETVGDYTFFFVCDFEE